MVAHPARLRVILEVLKRAEPTSGLAKVLATGPIDLLEHGAGDKVGHGA